LRGPPFGGPFFCACGKGFMRRQLSPVNQQHTNIGVLGTMAETSAPPVSR
jgi:hypothetical protein